MRSFSSDAAAGGQQHRFASPSPSCRSGGFRHRRSLLRRREAAALSASAQRAQIVSADALVAQSGGSALSSSVIAKATNKTIEELQSAPSRPARKAAYQGVPGAYSEVAALRACPDFDPLPCEQVSLPWVSHHAAASSFVHRRDVAKIARHRSLRLPSRL